MATGIAVARANASIDAVVALGTWIKLHVGDPGAAGASNASVETTRKQATFASAGSGSAATSADLTWANVAGTEDHSHFSMWTASTNGTFLWSCGRGSSPPPPTQWSRVTRSKSCRGI